MCVPCHIWLVCKVPRAKQRQGATHSRPLPRRTIGLWHADFGVSDVCLLGDCCYAGPGSMMMLVPVCGAGIFIHA